MREAKQTGQKDIGRIKLSDNQELIATLVDDEKLDLRIWVSGKSYMGFTKQGFRLYIFEGRVKTKRKA